MGNRPSSICGLVTLFSAGAVFAFGGPVSAQVTFQSLYSFGEGTSGTYPQAGLVQGSDGNFYGTTYDGGIDGCYLTVHSGCGTVFKITPEGLLTTLVKFDVTQGRFLNAGLVQGSDGNFYGTIEAEQRGRIQTLLHLLVHRFAPVPEDLKQQLQQLSDPTNIEQLTDAAPESPSLDDFRSQL